jgi:hypothetical protein
VAATRHGGELLDSAGPKILGAHGKTKT